MLNLIKFILIILFFAMPSYALEWNRKPVLCGEDIEIFPLLAAKNEILLFKGNIKSKVNDPDNDDGISDNAVNLPFAMYANMETKTFTILEYHNAPYNVFCLVGVGENLEYVLAAGESL
tara:strand:+ start:2981 stop:3337 length:357 start_codon:yes stop_codon:yes gene_type:complete